MTDTRTRAFEVALKALARKDRTRVEIISAFEREGITGEQAKEVADTLESWGYLDDQRIANREGQKNFQDRGFGKSRIRTDLARRGISDELIDEALASFSPADELAIALSLCSKKYEPTDDPQKAGRFLYSRGFDEETVLSTLETYFPAFEG